MIQGTSFDCPKEDSLFKDVLLFKQKDRKTQSSARLALVSFFFNNDLWEPHEEQFHASFSVYLYCFNCNHWVDVCHANIVDRLFVYPNEGQIVSTESTGEVITDSAGDPLLGRRNSNDDVKMCVLLQNIHCRVKCFGNEVKFNRLDVTLVATLTTNLYQRKLTYISFLLLWDK